MSSFDCEKCGTPILDGPHGYFTECEHYPIEVHVPYEDIKRLKETLWMMIIIR